MAAQDRSASRLGRDDDITEYAREQEEEESLYDDPFGNGNGSDLAALTGTQQSAEPDKTIYMLGTGSIGKLVAHALRSLPSPPPVTLLLHRPGLFRSWDERSKKALTVCSADSNLETEASGFDAELVAPPRREHGVELGDGMPSIYEITPREGGMRPHEAAKLYQREQEKQSGEQELLQASQQRDRIDGRARLAQDTRVADDETEKPIHNLIVSVKTPFTVSALSSVRHRLSRDSTIVFLQNGMGVIEEINEKLFPDESNRPSYIQGIITHGANVPQEVSQRDPFYVVHAGQGTIALGLLPRITTVEASSSAGSPANTPSPYVSQASHSPNEEEGERWPFSARHLLRTLTRSPILCAAGLSPNELLQQQLEKLAVNSIMNPLTALMDARNGALLYNFPLTRTMRLLLAETSLIIRSLPELQGVVNVQHRFSPERLETLVVGVSNRTAQNISSMLADIRAGRATEIEYINGYIVRRGEELGIKAVVNYGIMNAVIGKSLITQREAKEEVPVAKGPAPAATSREGSVGRK
ncbi:hypothetical protein K431DRAFT_310774 [Polychaeton citri CBS 116435]|uniref:2-dehydropantoate 2-reductase n=1 Tax=Polychaeton citri CBS 116435 TaxID=1314669 RepID=A0A9P4QCH9_9PEZI|nr:hypothetical protein K431DRAFT_310774 [Polychaeton citri CBS 116435]